MALSCRHEIFQNREAPHGNTKASHCRVRNIADYYELQITIKMPISFLIITVLMLGTMIFMLSEDVQSLSVVRAGDADKLLFGYKIVSMGKGELAEYQGNTVSLKGMIPMYVRGNSMKDSNINDGQTVYITKYKTDEEKQNITTYPVLVLCLYKKWFYSHYKLRKFVCYISDIEHMDWNLIYESHKEHIRLSYEDFHSVIFEKIEKMKRKGHYDSKETYIMSETYDEYKNLYSYSFHKVKDIYGKVRYVA